MAVDEALLESVCRQTGQPVLRLYAWQPACLSLGYAQPCSEVNLPFLQSKGWHIVRRPTGGRAILHTDELTYAVIAPQSEARVAGSVIESYLRLSQALLRALSLLGIPADLKETDVAPQEKKNPNPVCFETPSIYEITHQGKKIIGSAQARRGSGVLQHGSFPLFGDITRIIDCLQFPTEEAKTKAREKLLARAVNAESAQVNITWQNAADSFIQAFHETLNIDFSTSSLSAEEVARAKTLQQEKYLHPSWTERV